MPPRSPIRGKCRIRETTDEPTDRAALRSLRAFSQLGWITITSHSLVMPCQPVRLLAGLMTGSGGASSTPRPIGGQYERLWNTRSPAGACRRARRRRDPVAGDDGWGRGSLLGWIVTNIASRRHRPCRSEARRCRVHSSDRAATAGASPASGASRSSAGHSLT
jgi:hypothetical protein